MNAPNILLTTLALAGLQCRAGTIESRQLPPLPDTPGLAGAFVGSSQDALIVAGGANFPGEPPWDGGAKVWRDQIYVLPAPDAAWQPGGRLNHPVAYGVSISTERGLLCLGGCDDQQTYRDAFFLTWNGREIEQTPFTPLPEPLANAAGVQIDSRVYLVGGQPESNPLAGPASPGFYVIDLADDQPAWRSLPTWPGPGRFLPVVATDGRSLYLFSGAHRTPPQSMSDFPLSYLQDAYRYDPEANQWRRLADLPRPNAAAPSPAPLVDGRLLLLGNGADGTGVDLPLKQRPPIGGQVLGYDIEADRWEHVAQLPEGRVTTPAVAWFGWVVLATGEPQAGRRTPAVTAWNVHTQADPTRNQFDQ